MHAEPQALARMTEPASATTRVETLDLTDAQACAQWDAFVRAAPAATFFHLSGWGRALARVHGHRPHYLWVREGGQVRGVLPLAHMASRLFGASLLSLPFAVYGGVVAAQPEVAAALESQADALARALGVDHLELRHLERRHADWPAQDLYVTFRKPLLESSEANMNAIPRKQRAMVRKGIKQGLKAEVDGREMGRFFAVYADNVRRHGTPALPRRWFEALAEAFGDDVEVLTVTDAQGQPVSSVLSFYFRDQVLPYYAGDLPAARELAANDFKYWALMEHARARGARVFDYGRSKLGTGPYSFKKNWGFEPQPLHYEFRLYKADQVPQHNPNNPKYKLMIQAWRRLPLPVANWLGPRIVRGLG